MQYSSVGSPTTTTPSNMAASVGLFSWHSNQGNLAVPDFPRIWHSSEHILSRARTSSLYCLLSVPLPWARLNNVGDSKGLHHPFFFQPRPEPSLMARFSSLSWPLQLSHLALGRWWCFLHWVQTKTQSTTLNAEEARSLTWEFQWLKSQDEKS